MRTARCLLVIGSTLALAACATEPVPVAALPGPNKDMATFQKEDTACRTEAADAARMPQAAAAGQKADSAPNTNVAWTEFFARYSQCETSHGNLVQPIPWAAAYADYLGYNTLPAGYYGAPYAYGYGYPGAWGDPYAYAYDPYFYGDPFLFGYPYPFYFGADYGFGYGHFGFGHFGYGHFGGGHLGGGHFGGGFGHGGGGHR